MSSSSTTQTTINRRQLYRLTINILNSNSLHFIAISILFLPLTIAAVKFHSSATEFNLLTLKTLITLFTFISFIILPTVAGIAIITYNTNQAIHRKPLTFSLPLKSLSHSYVPLLHTFIVGSIALIILFIAFTLLKILVIESIKVLAFGFYNSDLFSFQTSVNSIISYALGVTIVYFIIIWGSASAVTVLDSKSGFEALRQSANQSNDFRRNSFSIVFITGFAIGTALSSSTVFEKTEPVENWILILQVMTVYLDPLLMILFYVVANTVLYVLCKVETGEEVAMKTVEDVRVVVNDKDGEVVNELGEETVNGGFSYMLYLLCIVWIVLLFRNMYHVWYFYVNK